MKLNLDFLLEMLWDYLALTCIFTKKRGRMYFLYSVPDCISKPKHWGQFKVYNNVQMPQCRRGKG